MNPATLVSIVDGESGGTVHFLTSISLADCPQIQRELKIWLKGKPRPEVQFRMDQVHYLDSSGLGMFVGLMHEFRTTTKFRFTGLRPNVRLVFEFSNLLHYFTVEEASGPVKAIEPPPPSPVAAPTEPSKESLAIAGKYFLTEDGVKYCVQKQIPIQDLRLYRGTTVSGFQWSSVNTGLLERFVTHGLLAGMELERTEFLEKREQILRLIEVLFDGIGMKRFRPLLKKRLMEHQGYRDLVAKGVSPARLRAAVQQHAATIAQLKVDIEGLVADRSSGMARTRTGPLLNLVDDSVWFLLTRGPATADNKKLRQIVLDTIVSYSGRLELSSMIALNLMEFIQQAEKAHFLNLAERDQFTRNNPQSIPVLLADAGFRQRLITKALLQKEMLVLNMNFEGNPHGAGGLVVEITVRNRGIVGNSLRSEALNKSVARGTGSVEEELLAQSSEEGVDELSLLNLASLKRLCLDLGITMETGLTKDTRANETVAFMKLVL